MGARPAPSVASLGHEAGRTREPRSELLASVTNTPRRTEAAAEAASPVRALVLPGFARWLGAALIDSVIGSAAVGAALGAALTLQGVRLAWQPIVDFVHGDLILGVVTLLLPPLLALFAVQLVPVLILGASLGQRVAGLRVVRSFDGAKPGAGRVCLRAMASSLGVVAFLAGPLWGFWLDRRRRGLGDLVARTVVARRPRSERATR